MEQLIELLNYYSINGIPNLSNYEPRTKSISRQSSQQAVRTHHSTGSISSLSTILGGTTNASSTATTTSSQPSSNIGHHNIHSLGTSFTSTTGIGNVTTVIAAAGIGLQSSSITPINQTSLQTAKSGSIKNVHAPLRNSKSTSSSLMNSQLNVDKNYIESSAQLIKEGNVRFVK